MKTGYDFKIQDLQKNLSATKNSSKTVEHTNKKALQEYEKKIQLLQEQINLITKAKNNIID